MRSNGCSVESSRRPITRISMSRNTNAATVRRTMSISGEPLSRVDGHAAVDAQDAPVTVVELDALGPAPRDGRRVHLLLDPEDERLARGDVAEVERELAVLARLSDPARLDRVHRHTIGP